MARAERHAHDSGSQVPVLTLPLISDTNVKRGLAQDSGSSLTKTTLLL